MMPRNTPSPDKAPDDELPEHATEEEILAMRMAFDAGFNRARTGSLLQEIDGTRLVVFRRDGVWSWLIDTGTDRPRYSTEQFEDELCAIGDLWRAWTGDV